MSYKDKFKDRNKRRYAEKKCIAFFNEKKITYTRYGFDCLDDIKPKDFMKIPEVLRNTPDYMVFLDKAVLIEVKGCYNTVRIKASDMKSYDWWSKLCPVTMFIYNKATDSYKCATYRQVRELALDINDKDYYPDNGKLYYKIPFHKIRGAEWN